ncbi:hypothetical protein B0J11DRAFT_570848 [Dendryphion nanum]|uniref:Uncharacterized protein n=1 Tax=Dendryphion nanum TaxID=256645 RepID=A0A9P9IF88_9PLEO|nr:hypothetical protein B0J11DRAFT_570848 [Dendryphion nanum]
MTMKQQHDENTKSKPLPCIPEPPDVSQVADKPLPPRPLPPLPAPPINAEGLDIMRTILIYTALGIWFIAIIVLLPVITEKDAMPGLNRLLRPWVKPFLDALGAQPRIRDEI